MFELDNNMELSQPPDEPKSEATFAASDGYAALVEKWRAEAKAKLERNEECKYWKDWPSVSCYETDAAMLRRCADELEAQHNAPVSDGANLERP